MATSPPAADPPATERRLDTLAAQAEAIDALIDLAQSRVAVFDRDLADTGWSSAARAARLAAFLRRPGAKLEVIVHDTRYLEGSCPRITALLKVYGHAMQVYRTGDEARGATDALVIADERHYLHRYHADQPRATFATDAPASARPLVERFAQIWASGEPGLGGRVLGL